jgi:hypothetical protein
MPASITWHEPGRIILYTMSDPLTLDELERAAEEVWALAGGVHEVVDMIFDYRALTDFPRGTLPLVREGSVKLPTLERVALVGNAPLVEMVMTTLTQSAYRPHPTVHETVSEAASFLKQMAQQDDW